MAEKGSPLNKCFAFIDGTFRKTCRFVFYGAKSVIMLIFFLCSITVRPTFYQRVSFSGHKRGHGIKFQSIVSPDGIIQEMFGPFPASRHDAGILRESGLLSKLHQSLFVDGEWFYLYGDPAYPLRPYLLSPCRGVLNESEAAFNYQMSKVRQCVEWGFKDVIQYFAFLDFEKNQKIFLQPIAVYFQVATVLRNCMTCMRNGNQTSAYFMCPPPTLEEYLSFD